MSFFDLKFFFMLFFTGLFESFLRLNFVCVVIVIRGLEFISIKVLFYVEFINVLDF